MILGLLLLVMLALWANIMFYEYRVAKRPKQDTDIMAGYLKLARQKNINNVK